MLKVQLVLVPSAWFSTVQQALCLFYCNDGVLRVFYPEQVQTSSNQSPIEAMITSTFRSKGWPNWVFSLSRGTTIDVKVDVRRLRPCDTNGIAASESPVFFGEDGYDLVPDALSCVYRMKPTGTFVV